MAAADCVLLRGEPPVRLAPLLHDALQIAVPNICIYVLTFINEFTNTIFVGHMGNEAMLAAVGLGNMMQNCFGLSIGLGIAAALDTLVSQAHGAKQTRLSCLYLQRCRVLLALQLLWMLPVLCFSDVWLLLLHQDPEVVHHAGNYNRASAWGLFAIFQFTASRNFLCNQGLATTPAVICGVCSMLHVVWCWLFIVHQGMGPTGAGLANVVTWWLQFLISCVYLHREAPRLGFEPREVLWISRGGLEEWSAYLEVAVPAVIQLCSEWWFWELMTLVVGYMGSVALAAHTATQSVVVISLMPCAGIAVSTATLVGNALGANEPRRARCIAGLGVAANAAIWLALALGMLLGRDLLAAAYTSQEEVKALMHRLLGIFTVAGFFDSSQQCLGGALRGLGKPELAAAVYLASYYGVMLPLGCVLGFALHLGIDGIWYSFMAGTAINGVIFATVLWCADYQALAKESSEHMKREGRACESLAEKAHETIFRSSGARVPAASSALSPARTTYRSCDGA